VAILGSLRRSRKPRFQDRALSPDRIGFSWFWGRLAGTFESAIALLRDLDQGRDVLKMAVSTAFRGQRRAFRRSGSISRPACTFHSAASAINMLTTGSWALRWPIVSFFRGEDVLKMGSDVVKLAWGTSIVASVCLRCGYRGWRALRSAAWTSNLGQRASLPRPACILSGDARRQCPVRETFSGGRARIPWPACTISTAS